MYADAVWSHYMYVRNRVHINNPDRVVKGIQNAQDWPSQPVVFNALYLLVLADAPMGSQGYSQYRPMQFHNVQWVWIVKGTDLKPGEKAANRGDRFVISQNIKGELLYGTAPGYTEKLSWALNSTGTFIGTPLSEQVTLTWNPVDFHETLDKDSGVTYGSGALRIWDCTDVISS